MHVRLITVNATNEESHFVVPTFGTMKCMQRDTRYTIQREQTDTTNQQKKAFDNHGEFTMNDTQHIIYLSWSFLRVTFSH